MPNQGQPAQRSIQSFQPTESPLTGVLPTGLTALGGGLSALAVALATVPPNAALGSVVQTMERIGLDKGPLFLFGVGIAGVGLALRGQRRARTSGGVGLSLDAVADHVTSEVESVTAILGGIQVEVNAVRADVHETRRELAESASSNAPGAGEASDPMFRLAASLDQLGARVDKRMDAARKEMGRSGRRPEGGPGAGGRAGCDRGRRPRRDPRRAHRAARRRGGARRADGPPRRGARGRARGSALHRAVRARAHR
ncbi:MAG: hypothetical protein AAFP86_11320, partial [Planctomycetota bacterium]